MFSAFVLSPNEIVSPLELGIIFYFPIIQVFPSLKHSGNKRMKFLHLCPHIVAESHFPPLPPSSAPLGLALGLWVILLFSVSQLPPPADTSQRWEGGQGHCFEGGPFPKPPAIFLCWFQCFQRLTKMSSLKKAGNPAICSNIDGHWRTLC